MVRLVHLAIFSMRGICPSRLNHPQKRWGTKGCAECTFGLMATELTPPLRRNLGVDFYRTSASAGAEDLPDQPERRVLCPIPESFSGTLRYMKPARSVAFSLRWTSGCVTYGNRIPPLLATVRGGGLLDQEAGEQADAILRLAARIPGQRRIPCFTVFDGVTSWSPHTAW
jgi:hypothetical protein